MDMHSNARTCPNSRATIVDHVRAGCWSSDQAFTLGISVRTGYKWWQRFRTEGIAGLEDRSSQPHAIANRTSAEREQLVLRLRQCGEVAREIAVKLRMPRSTVSAILKRQGVSRLSDLTPPEPVRLDLKRRRRSSVLRARAKPLGLPSLRSAVTRARPAARRRRTD